MITFKKITADNFEDCLRLSVTDEQKVFVASNAYSLAEAYALTNHPLYVPLPLGIYVDDTMVGFVMVNYEPIDKNNPDDYEDIYYLARMMIDKRYQGKGYGKEALHKLIAYIKTYPLGKAKAIVLSCNINNHKAYSLYVAAGFKEMGIQDADGDNLLRLELE